MFKNRFFLAAFAAFFVVPAWATDNDNLDTVSVGVCTGHAGKTIRVRKNGVLTLRYCPINDNDGAGSSGSSGLGMGVGGSSGTGSSGGGGGGSSGGGGGGSSGGGRKLHKVVSFGNDIWSHDVVAACNEFNNSVISSTTKNQQSHDVSVGLRGDRCYLKRSPWGKSEYTEVSSAISGERYIEGVLDDDCNDGKSSINTGSGSFSVVCTVKPSTSDSSDSGSSDSLGSDSSNSADGSSSDKDKNDDISERLKSMTESIGNKLDAVADKLSASLGDVSASFKDAADDIKHTLSTQLDSVNNLLASINDKLRGLEGVDGTADDGTGNNQDNGQDGASDGNNDGDKNGKDNDSQDGKCKYLPDFLCGDVGDVAKDADFAGIEIPQKQVDVGSWSEDVFLPKTGVCPEPVSVSVGGTTIEIPYHFLCRFAEYIRGVVLASFALIAGFIFIRGVN